MIDPGIFTPDVQILLYGLVNSALVWIGKRLGLDPLRLWAVVCIIVGTVYVSQTLDPASSVPLWLQLLLKAGITVTVSAGIFKTVRMMNGQDKEAKERLIQKGIDIGNAQNQATVTVVPVQSDSPVIIGTPVVVTQPVPVVAPDSQTVPPVVPVAVVDPVVPPVAALDPESKLVDGISPAARLSSDQRSDPTQ